MSEEIRNKMYDFEIDPPSDAWKNIVSMLEVTEEDKRVSVKINTLTLTPPPDAWENIQKQLAAPVIKIAPGNGFFTFKRMAIAAAVIGLVIVSSVLFFRNKQDTGIASANTNRAGNPISTVDQPGKGTQSANDSGPGGNNTEQITGNNDNGAIAASSFTPSRKYYSANTKTGELASSNRSDAEEKLHQNTLSNTEESKLYAAADNTDRYYNLMDENGNIIRVSKKLVTLDCVIKNGLLVPIDNKDKSENSDCEEKVKEWYKIMNQSPAINSPLDLLNIISTGG